MNTAFHGSVFLWTFSYYKGKEKRDVESITKAV